MKFTKVLSSKYICFFAHDSFQDRKLITEFETKIWEVYFSGSVSTFMSCVLLFFTDNQQEQE